MIVGAAGVAALRLFEDGRLLIAVLAVLTGWPPASIVERSVAVWILPVRGADGGVAGAAGIMEAAGAGCGARSS